MSSFKYRIVFPDTLSSVGFIQLCFYKNINFSRVSGIVYCSVNQSDLKYFTDSVAFYSGSADLVTTIPSL